MIRAYIVLLFIIAAAGFTGVVDRQSSEVVHRAAMEAPRPIFEQVHELRRLTPPCTTIKQDLGRGNRDQPMRCTKADRRTE